MASLPITLEEVRKCVDVLKACAVPPKIINNQDEADRQNRIGEAIGLSHKWKVGDHYYDMKDLVK